VNCVAPGAIQVDRTIADDPSYPQRWGQVTPLGRIGTPADVASAVLFLAGPEASFITGQTLWVDGALFTRPQWPY
jgi:NAD(P)-dependent dehydrogenase (short-subunit alcohol dehydrogenase family)